ncbi:hypothetical protein DFH09DRAFT_1367469 [Mycena vulgaris]|nr:hypothetical protein DFH09DRAFT_1367469 [Mycena vulgaris]
MAHAGIVKGTTRLFVARILGESPAIQSVDLVNLMFAHFSRAQGLIIHSRWSSPRVESLATSPRRPCVHSFEPFVFLDALEVIIRMIPQTIPKAYRFIKEMDEIAGFVGPDEGKTFEGLEHIFGRVATAYDAATAGAGGDVEVDLKFVKQARERGISTSNTVLYRN